MEKVMKIVGKLFSPNFTGKEPAKISAFIKEYFLQSFSLFDQIPIFIISPLASRAARGATRKLD